MPAGREREGGDHRGGREREGRPPETMEGERTGDHARARARGDERRRGAETGRGRPGDRPPGGRPPPLLRPETRPAPAVARRPSGRGYRRNPCPKARPPVLESAPRRQNANRRLHLPISTYFIPRLELRPPISF